MSAPAAFTLTVLLGNDTMSTRADVAYALREVADRLVETAPAEPFADVYVGLSFGIQDGNGNRVGSWSLT